MAFARLAVLLFATFALSSSAVFLNDALRAESATLKAEMLTLSPTMWNNTITQFVQHEIVMPEAPPQGPKVVDKALYILVTMFFGMCGVDRCFMGQVCLGVLKGLTFGGLVMWQLVDYFVCMYSCLSSAPTIDTLGHDATFKEGTIETAYFIGCGFLGMHSFMVCYYIVVACMIHKMQMAMQLQIQEQMKEAMLKQGMEEDDIQKTMSVPHVQQTLAHVPTPFAKALRMAGVIENHPSIPELIAAFQKIDKDGDGQLDRDELKEALSGMGVNEEDVDAMIKEADVDKDGKISKDEFLNYHAKRAAEEGAKKGKKCCSSTTMLGSELLKKRAEEDAV